MLGFFSPLLVALAWFDPGVAGSGVFADEFAEAPAGSSDAVGSSAGAATVSGVGAAVATTVGSADGVAVAAAVGGYLADWPTFKAAGSAAFGIGDISPAWPSHDIDDLALLFVESANETISLSVAAGFVEVANSPLGVGTAGANGATRIAVYWCRATSAAMSSPTVADPGNHAYAVILTYQNAIETGNPVDVSASSGNGTSTTTALIPGATTTVDNALVVGALAWNTDQSTSNWPSATNASLASVDTRHDAGTTDGNGGGLSIFDGGLAAAGAYNDFTGTLGVSATQARISIAIKPIGSGGTDAVGSSDGTSSASATGASLAASDGNAAGSATAGAVAQSLASSTGESSGIASASGASSVSSATVGDSAGAASVTGAASAIASAVGSSAGESSADGVAQTAYQSIGASDGSSTVVGASASIASAIGSSAGLATAIGVSSALGQTSAAPPTVPEMRDRFAALVANAVPEILARSRFVEARGEHAGDLQAWAEQHPAAAFRRFSVRYELGDELLSPSNTDSELRRTRFDVTVAYPHDHRSGSGAALDRDELIDLDMHTIVDAIGPRAGTPATVNADRVAASGIDLLIVSLDVTHWVTFPASAAPMAIGGSTLPATLRDRLSELVHALTPASLARDRFVEARAEYAGDFEGWASRNTAAAWRRFLVRHREDHDVRNSFESGEGRTVIFEVLVAYAHNHRAGPSAMRRHQIINEDRHAIEGAIGLRGYANFADAAWIQGSAEMQPGAGFDLLTLSATMHFTRSTP